jgi:hypothetical protein
MVWSRQIIIERKRERETLKEGTLRMMMMMMIKRHWKTPFSFLEKQKIKSKPNLKMLVLLVSILCLLSWVEKKVRNLKRKCRRSSISPTLLAAAAVPLSFLLAERMIQKSSLSFTKKREQRQKEDKDTAELLAISQARKLFIFFQKSRERGGEGGRI